mgnify:CR=1 FL=1
MITVYCHLATYGNAHSSVHIFKASSEISGAKGSGSNAGQIHCAATTGYDSSSNNGHQHLTLHSCSFQYLDIAGSSGSNIDYEWRVRAREANGWYVNRSYGAGGNMNDNAYTSPISTITLQEIMRA